MDIHILEMPLDYGANRHGSDMGPSAMRLAGLKEKIQQLGHNITRSFSPIEFRPQEYEEIYDEKAKYLPLIVKACNNLAQSVKEAINKNAFPLVLGGDHSIALGTIAGLSSEYRKKNLRFGVVYIDAHGDFNTCETTLTGNIHGMCLAASCGYGIKPLTELFEKETKVDSELVFYIGLRDVDPKERELMHKAKVKTLTMADIDRIGFTESVKQLIKFIKTKTDVVHVSVDMDVIDPMFAPGVGIPLPGGLTYREILLLMEELAKTNKVKSAEIVEVNPVLDVRNQTAAMAVEIVGRLLGGTIY
ncbi:MAG: arginase [Treponema sp.]|jgi:arginase|nr:arginase [Treponema sp.]